LPFRHGNTPTKPRHHFLLAPAHSVFHFTVPWVFWALTMSPAGRQNLVSFILLNFNQRLVLLNARKKDLTQSTQEADLE
jgi:hypothetical protein